jgi:hypothetical protein
MALNDNSHEERVLEALTSRSLPAEDHLLACASCRSERDRIQQAIGTFAAAAREATDRPGYFWTRQAAQINSRLSESATRPGAFGLRMVPALALLALLAFLLLQSAPTPPSHATQSTVNSDHELLVEVERALQRDTPAALEPVTLLVEDMNRTTPNAPGFSKEQTRHVN